MLQIPFFPRDFFIHNLYIFQIMTPMGSMKGVLWEPQDHFSSYKTQKQPACWRISGRWIVLTSVYYGLHWLPGCFWMLFKGLTLIYGAVYILSQKLFIQKNHPQWARWNRAIVEAAHTIILSYCRFHSYLLIHYLGKFSSPFPPLLTGRPPREEKEPFYSLVFKHYRWKLSTLVYSILN